MATKGYLEAAMASVITQENIDRVAREIATKLRDSSGRYHRKSFNIDYWPFGTIIRHRTSTERLMVIIQSRWDGSFDGLRLDVRVGDIKGVDGRNMDRWEVIEMPEA